jgi:hypothetical protein
VDELWQRYRTFWVPVLYGVGALLAGLIVVNIVTADPDAGRSQNEARAATIGRFTAPSDGQIRDTKATIEVLKKETARKAALVDQRHGDGDDVAPAFVKQALRAAILRGSEPADVLRFDGDAAAKDQASALYAQLVADRVALLQTQDPNVAFSRLRADVVQALEVRMNRADVDVATPAEGFGVASIASVERAELPRRLANLALIATVLDLAIREGVRSVDGVAILPPDVHGAVQGPDAFLAEWPVKIDLTGTPEALTAILNLLTDPARPTPLGTCSWKQTAKKDGLVKAEFRVYSIRVRADAVLGLESEGGE